MPLKISEKLSMKTAFWSQFRRGTPLVLSVALALFTIARTTGLQSVATIDNERYLLGGKLGGMAVSIDWRYPGMEVWIKPSSSVIADKTYEIYIYEKGNQRYVTTISWSQPEVNVQTTKPTSEDRAL